MTKSRLTTLLPTIASLVLYPAVAWCDPPTSKAQSSATSVPSADTDPLLEGFQSPPQAARPQVWWHLMNGNITKEGMELDLAWMARTGIGGVHAFSGALLEPTVVAKPLPFMSDGWREAFRFGVSRARALGMEVTIAGSPGWSETGGPWVPPADGMKKYVWSERRLTGGRTISIDLAPLPQATGIFQLAGPAKPGRLRPLPAASGTGPVIAFPVADDNEPPATYSSGGVALPDMGAETFDLASPSKLALAKQGDTTIEVAFVRPRAVRALTLAIDPPLPFELQASSDGHSFTTIGRFAGAPGETPAPQQTVAFDRVRATAMRIVLSQPIAGGVHTGMMAAPTQASVRLIRFSDASRLSRFEAKAGFQPTFADDTTPRVQTLPGIDPSKIVDLTGKVTPDGRLVWRAPPGRWAVVRFGWSLTGRTNAPAEPQATGLEVDKFDSAAVRRYLEHYLDLYKRDTGVELGKGGVGGLLTDSWEAGVQNWTPTMLVDFRRLRGYDATPWLPVLSGYVVRDEAASNAFLADFRQTLKDLVITSHYRVLSDVAHEHGMIYYTEVQGDLPRAISDGLTAKGQSDIPTAEFWARAFTAGPGQPALQVDLKEASSAAHIYGRPLAAAESFTMAALDDPWSTAPNYLKRTADRIFALGINRILYHDSHHQPFVDKVPGLQLAIHGQWFNRNETWAEQARPWSDYLARSSYMLQQGSFVADIGYLYGEDRSLTDLFQQRLNTEVPAGYGFDYIDPSSLKKLSVADGQTVTTSGMHYRVLYLAPSADRMTLPYAHKLLDLVKAGAVLVGTPPAGVLGLEATEAKLAAVSEQLWPQGSSDVLIGKGRVIRSSDLKSALAVLGFDADVTSPAGSDLMTLHRRADLADIFYLSNQATTPLEGVVRFRMTGRSPEWWSPETGKAHAVPYQDDGKTISIPLKLVAEEAGFVVFRSSKARVGSLSPTPKPVFEQHVVPLEGPWKLSFQVNRGAPAAARFATLHDWTRDENAGIRYFSGRATYSRTLSVPDRMRKGGRLILDLGDVHELASVRINGLPVATAWHAPYRIDVTHAVRPGRNTLEIDVANLWVNRLVGDAQPGAIKITYAPQAHYAAATPLRPSGLIGPVVLRQDFDTAFAF